MKLFMVLVLLGLPGGSPVIHSMKFFHTSSSGIPEFPEFVGVGYVDEMEITHYDSKSRRAEPKQDWMNRITEEEPEFWEEETEIFRGNQQIDKGNIETAKQRFNQTGGVHLFQRMSGCDWDDETDEVTGFDQFGFDGEDFLALDMKTETWVAPVPQAVLTKLKLDNNRALMAQKKHYFTTECPKYLKKLLKLGEKVLMRKVLPSVSLLQKTPSCPVSCHATGFYPNRADLFWRRDDEGLHEGVDKGEVLPNHDGTFQMSVDLDVSSVPAEDWGRFHCVFQLDGVPEDVLTPLDRWSIRSNRPRFPTAEVLGGLGGLGVLTGIIIGLVCWKRNNEASEASSSSGEPSGVEKDGSEELSMLDNPAGQ